MRYFLVAVVFALSGCAKSAEERTSQADGLAAAHHWQKTTLRAGMFELAAFTPKNHPAGETITVYLEGDGHAWRTRSMPSQNPTPENPVGLKLALKHPSQAVAYLGRPCQYVDLQTQPACTNIWWTDKRFAPEVIASVSSALDQLKREFSAKKLILVGYSGGGAVALLVASGRNDVAEIITVAGNLDTKAWTGWHGVTPLTGSLNPADFAARLAAIPQQHFVGSKDTVIPKEMSASYAARVPAGKKPAIDVIEGYTHGCCWDEHWPLLWLNRKTHRTDISVLGKMADY